MFWSKRRESRSDLYTTTNKNQIQQQLPAVPRRTSLSANSSPRQPFVLLDPLDPQASQSSLAAAADEMPLSSNSSSSNVDSAAIKHAISRQIVHRDAIDPKSNQYVNVTHTHWPQPFNLFLTQDQRRLRKRHVAHNQIKLAGTRFLLLTHLHPIYTQMPLR